MVIESRGRAATFTAPPLIAASAVVVFAFLFRLLTFRDLSNDHYMHLGWAQQLLFGDLPGRDFVDPGLPLQYAVSAVVQWLWPGPFSEGVASIILLALAAGCVTLVTGLGLRSVSAGVVAGLVAIAWLPRFYGYPKVLVPAVTLWLVARYAQRPGRLGTTLLAVWTIVATLLRHDLGVFAALAVVAGLLAASIVSLRDRLRNVAMYGVTAAVVSLPYLAFVQWTEGVTEHLRVGNEFAKTDTHQLMLAPADWPAFVGLSPGQWLADPGAFLFWLTHLLLAAVLVLAVHEVRRGRDSAPFVVSAAVFLLCYRLTILRHSLDARLPDMAAVYAVSSVIVFVAAVRFVRAQITSRPVAALATAVVVIIGGGWATVAMERTVSLRAEIRKSGLLLGPRAMAGQVARVLDRAASGSWDVYWPAGEIPAVIGYLTECTGNRDRLLTTWPSAEYHFFARRAFSAGQLAFFHRDAFSSERDQTLAIERLQQQYVPVVLINQTDYAEFRQAFPMIADYIATHYEQQGQFSIRDGSQVVIAVRKDLRPRRTFGDQQWPCDFESRRGAADTAE